MANSRMQKKAIKKAINTISTLGRCANARFNPSLDGCQLWLGDHLIEGVNNLVYVATTYGCRMPDEKQAKIIKKGIRLLSYRKNHIGYNSFGSRDEWRNYLIEELKTIGL